jgi:hypothetical protein
MCLLFHEVEEGVQWLHLRPVGSSHLPYLVRVKNLVSEDHNQMAQKEVPSLEVGQVVAVFHGTCRNQVETLVLEVDSNHDHRILCPFHGLDMSLPDMVDVVAKDVHI